MKKRLVSFFVAVLMVFASIPVYAGDSAVASTMRLESIDGDVTITNKNGSIVSVRKGAKLYDGYSIVTDAASYVFISLDAAKIIKLDANSEAEIRQSGKNLEVDLKSGSLLFNVTQPVPSDGSFNIRTSTMVTGIRGTAGYVTARTFASAQGGDTVSESNVALITGTVVITTSNGNIATAGGAVNPTVQQTITAGQMLVVTESRPTTPESPDDTSASPAPEYVPDITTNVLKLDETLIPGFVGVEIRNEADFQKGLADNTDIDVDALMNEADQKLKDDIQKAEEEKLQQAEAQKKLLELALLEQILVDSVFGTPKPKGGSSITIDSSIASGTPTATPTATPIPTTTPTPVTLTGTTLTQADLTAALAGGPREITIAAGAVLTISSNFSLPAGATLINNGTLNINNATFDNLSDTTFKNEPGATLNMIAANFNNGSVSDPGRTSIKGTFSGDTNSTIINYNGTFTIDTVYMPLHSFINHSTLTIADATLEATLISEAGSIVVTGSSVLEGKGNVTFPANDCAAVVMKGGSLTMTGGYIVTDGSESNNRSLRMHTGTPSVTLTGVTMSGTQTGIVAEKGTLVINSMTAQTPVGMSLLQMKDAAVTIQNCGANLTMNAAATTSYIVADSGGTGTLTISGTNFNHMPDPSANNVSLFNLASGTHTLSGAAVTTTMGPTTTNRFVYCDGANTKLTITNSSFTGSAYAAFQGVNGAELVLNGVTASNTSTNPNSSVVSSAGGSAVNRGKVTISGGSYSGFGCVASTNAYTDYIIKDNATLTQKVGASGAVNGAIYIHNTDNTVTLESGDISTEAGVNGTTVVQIADSNNTFTMSGGSVTQNSSVNNVVHAVFVNSTAAGNTVNISGGTVENKCTNSGGAIAFSGAFASITNISGTATVVHSGGASGSVFHYDSGSEMPAITISGGTVYNPTGGFANMTMPLSYRVACTGGTVYTAGTMEDRAALGTVLHQVKLTGSTLNSGAATYILVPTNASGETTDYNFLTRYIDANVEYGFSSDITFAGSNGPGINQSITITIDSGKTVSIKKASFGLMNNPAITVSGGTLALLDLTMLYSTMSLDSGAKVLIPAGGTLQLSGANAQLITGTGSLVLNNTASVYHKGSGSPCTSVADNTAFSHNAICPVHGSDHTILLRN